MSFVVTIDSTDRTSNVVFPSLIKTDQLNQQVDTLTFSIKKYGSSQTYVPSINEEVVVTKDGTNIFGGVIVKIRERIEAGQILIYEITCNDYSQYLKRKLVTERYDNMTVLQIITDIVDTYAADFTYTNVNGSLTIDSISFNRLTVAECLEKLAEAIAYIWYVDYSKDIHFFPKNTEFAPFDITDTSSNYIYNSLEITEDLSQIKNSVLVQGGEIESASERTEYFEGDGVKDTFPLANKFASTPDVVVGTFTQTVGIEFLDEDASYDCMWNFNQKYLRFTTGNVPSTSFTVEGIYLYPIVVKVPNPSSINEFGYYEYAITDKSIKTQDEAINRAVAELDAYKDQLYEGKFSTYTDGVRSGQVMNINSSARGKNINILIKSVKSKMRNPDGSKLQYDVKFVTLKSIGIIEYLQKQLRDREIVVDDQETLLNLITISQDTVTSSDSIATSTSAPPYIYGVTTGNTGDWGYATWT